MENQASSKSIILNYGLYLGVVSVLFGLIKYAMGYLYAQEYYSFILGLIAMIVFIVLGMKAFKNANGGLISFGQGVKIGIGVTMIATLIIIAFYFLLSTVIEPDFIQNSIEANKTVMRDTWGMTEEQIETATEGAEDNFYLNMFGGILIVNLFLGGVISLITAAVVKKTEENQY